MAPSAGHYISRADECARLVNLTTDEMIQAVLLRQCRMYLKMAKNLGIVTDVVSGGAAGKRGIALR